MTADLVAFLRQQLDHDEQVALDARGDGPSRTGVWTLLDRRDHPAGPNLRLVDDLGYEVTDSWDVDSAPWYSMPHIALHDPARVLRQVTAHRAILDAYETALVSRDVAEGTVLAGATRLSLRVRREAVGAVASIYSDRPGWDPSWTVEG